MTQVHDNRESQRRQYELADHARTLGWTQVEVIDDDLGRSGSGRVARPGFERLVSAVCLEEVGAVLALEVSRLARNSRDWAHLVDLCGLTSTLIIDGEGIYDPRDFNDRLLLGLKGTMSEWELGVLRQRSLAALKQKAERGELYTSVAIGFLRTRDAAGTSRVELDPDLRIQEAIRGVFRSFARTGSVRQTLLWFRSERIALPAVRYGPFGRAVEWKVPVYGTVHKMLTNPIYAGAYAYGRTTTRTTVANGRAEKRRGAHTARADWAVLLRDHHPGYIDWSEYEAHQATIAENAQMKGLLGGRGAPRRGIALLAGLLRCRRCGRRLHVTYSGTNGTVRRYACQGAAINHGTDKCLSFGGRVVEAAVEAAVLTVIAPGAIEAAIGHPHRPIRPTRNAGRRRDCASSRPGTRPSVRGASTMRSIPRTASSRPSWSDGGTRHSPRWPRRSACWPASRPRRPPRGPSTTGRCSRWPMICPPCGTTRARTSD